MPMADNACPGRATRPRQGSQRREAIMDNAEYELWSIETPGLGAGLPLSARAIHYRGVLVGQLHDGDNGDRATAVGNDAEVQGRIDEFMTEYHAREDAERKKFANEDSDVRAAREALFPGKGNPAPDAKDAQDVPAWAKKLKPLNATPRKFDATPENKAPAPKPKVTVKSERNQADPINVNKGPNQWAVAGTVLGYFGLVLFALVVFNLVRAILP